MEANCVHSCLSSEVWRLFLFRTRETNIYLLFGLVYLLEAAWNLRLLCLHCHANVLHLLTHLAIHPCKNVRLHIFMASLTFYNNNIVGIFSYSFEYIQVLFSFACNFSDKAPMNSESMLSMMYRGHAHVSFTKYVLCADFELWPLFFIMTIVSYRVLRSLGHVLELSHIVIVKLFSFYLFTVCKISSFFSVIQPLTLDTSSPLMMVMSVDCKFNNISGEHNRNHRQFFWQCENLERKKNANLCSDVIKHHFIPGGRLTSHLNTLPCCECRRAIMQDNSNNSIFC